MIFQVGSKVIMRVYSYLCAKFNMYMYTAASCIAGRHICFVSKYKTCIWIMALNACNPSPIQLEHHYSDGKYIRIHTYLLSVECSDVVLSYVGVRVTSLLLQLPWPSCYLILMLQAHFSMLWIVWIFECLVLRVVTGAAIPQFAWRAVRNRRRWLHLIVCA